MNSQYQGKLTKFSALEPEKMAALLSKWSLDDLFLRLLNSCPAALFTEKTQKEWLEEDLKDSPNNSILFTINTLEEDKPIGFFEIYPSWHHGDAWVGIGIGERKNWDKGYGTDAMQIGLKFAFHEINLERVTLGVFGYNARALRSYEKAGFKLEGAHREALLRDGKRYDALVMGILKEEWLLINK